MIVLKKLFGDDAIIFDPIVGWPVEKPKNIDDCYACHLYSEKKRWDTVNNTKGVFTRIEKYGGVGAFETNDEAWKLTESGDLITYLTEDRTSPFGVDGPVWAIVWNFEYLVVLKLDWDGDDLIRVSVIFRPWCKMIFSKAGVRIDWWKLVSSEKTAKSAHWAFNFFQQLADPNASLVTDTSYDRLVDDNIFFHSTNYVFELKLEHISPKAACLSWKDKTYGAKKNAFDPSFTNLRRTRGRLDLFGRSVRAHDMNLLGDKDRVSRDNMFRCMAISFGTR